MIDPCGTGTTPPELHLLGQPPYVSAAVQQQAGLLRQPPHASALAQQRANAEAEAAGAGERAYATWYRLTTSVGDVRRPWPLLEPETRALWEAIAQAVLSASQEDDA